MRVLVVLCMVSLAFAGCASTPDETEPEPLAQALTFSPHVPLECPDYPQYRQACGQFGEPQLEVAGDGTIWYSAVCCVGQSPPIWRSFDGGLTFEAMPNLDGTGSSRDAFGIEGDFAIDDAGNVYFFDISLASTYFTKYSADGTHQFTKPDAFLPLVDRPWVRAGAEDEVFIAYNTGRSTWFYSSTDGGLTWDLPGGTEFPCALMTLGQGPVRDHLIMSGCTGSPSAWISMDGGATWGERIQLGVNDANEFYMQPAADAAGTTYVPVTHEEADGSRISVVAIAPDGTAGEPVVASFTDGIVDKPWLIAGKDGVAAMAYYGARNVSLDNDREAEWYLHVSYSLNASAENPEWVTVVADNTMVLKGPFGRSLGDFLQLRQAPNGDLVVAYAMRDSNGLTNLFVRGGGLDFAPEVFRNGPAPA